MGPPPIESQSVTRTPRVGERLIVRNESSVISKRPAQSFSGSRIEPDREKKVSPKRTRSDTLCT